MMSKLETGAVVERLRVAFRTDVTADLLGIWHDHLHERDFPTACAAADRFIGEGGMFFPTLSEFNTAYRQELARQRAKNEQAAIKAKVEAKCSCDPVGFIVVSDDGHGTVRRCPDCNPEPSLSPDDHPAKCQCAVCHYGPKEAAKIRAGGRRTSASLREVPNEDVRYEVDREVPDGF